MSTSTNSSQGGLSPYAVLVLVALALIGAAVAVAFVLTRPTVAPAPSAIAPTAVVDPHDDLALPAPTGELPSAHGGVDLDGPPITLVSVGEAKGSLDTGEALFVDVRSGDDFRAGHISGAVSLTSPDLDAAMRALPPGSQIIAYGDAARPDSAVRAAQIFIELGYPTVIALEGGYQAWVNAGHPVTTPDI